MRIDYLKDITNLKEYIYQSQSNYNGADYIDVRYFEASKDLDERIQFIINEKSKAMTDVFNSKINKILKLNEVLTK